MATKIQETLKWYEQFDNTDIVIKTLNKRFDINLDKRALPHLLGLHYTGISLKGRNLYNFYLGKTDEEIFSLVQKNTPQKLNNVQNRVEYFKSFMENLEKATLYEQTHPTSKIQSLFLLVELEKGKYLHLGIAEKNQSTDYLETFLVDTKDHYIKNSTIEEKIISLEKYDGDILVPFSFKELKEIDEQSHSTEVAKEKAAFSFSVEDLKKFSPEQIYQIQDGLQSNVDVSIYAKEEFDAEQMEVIRLGLENGIDVTVYASPHFNGQQMREIRLGLEKGLDVTVYASPHFNAYQMEQILLGLEQSLDVTVYANSNFNAAQMEAIHWGLKQGLDVSAYTNPNLPASQMHDIRDKLSKEKEKANTKANKKGFLDFLISKKKEEIKQEEAAKSSPFPRKGEVER